jgi:DNA-binding IscR family transcriptional regulator
VLSQTADHALRAMLVLARRHGAGPVRTEEIAEATGAPRNYLSKTLRALARRASSPARAAPPAASRSRRHPGR